METGHGQAQAEMVGAGGLSMCITVISVDQGFWCSLLKVPCVFASSLSVVTIDFLNLSKRFCWPCVLTCAPKQTWVLTTYFPTLLLKTDSLIATVLSGKRASTLSLLP